MEVLLQKLQFYDIPPPLCGDNDTALQWKDFNIVIHDSTCTLTFDKANLFVYLNKLLYKDKIELPTFYTLADDILNCIFWYIDDISSHFLNMTCHKFFSRLFLFRKYRNPLTTIKTNVSLVKTLITTNNFLLYATKMDAEDWMYNNNIRVEQLEILLSNILRKSTRIFQLKYILDKYSVGTCGSTILRNAIVRIIINLRQSLSFEEQKSLAESLVSIGIVTDRLDIITECDDGSINIGLVAKWIFDLAVNKKVDFVSHFVRTYPRSLNDYSYGLKSKIMLAQILPLSDFISLYENGYDMRSRRFSNIIVRFRNIEIITWFFLNYLLVSPIQAAMNYNRPEIIKILHNVNPSYYGMCQNTIRSNFASFIKSEYEELKAKK